MYAPRLPEDEAAIAERQDDPGALGRGWRICYAPPAAQHLLQEAAGARQAVVVADEQGILWVAVSQPAEPQLPGELASATRRPVRLIAAAPDEIALALARYAGEAEAGALRTARLGRLASDLGLGYLLQTQTQTLPAATSGQVGATDLAQALPNGWGPEILGLLEGLPHLSPGVAALRLPLRLLLPPELRYEAANGNGTRRPLLAPWCLEGDTLLLACDDLPPQAQLEAISAWTGLRVRPLLCETKALQQALRSGTPTRKLVPLGRRLRAGGGPPSWDDELDMETRRQVLALALQLEVPAEVAARHLLGTRPDEAGPSGMPHPTPEALATIPPQLARSLAVLPLRLTPKHLEVALATLAPDAEVAAALAIVTGQAIRLRRVAPAALRGAQARAYPERATHPAPTPVAELSNLVAAATAAGDQQTACQAQAAIHGLPAIRLEHYAAMPEVASLVPIDSLRELRAVPLRQEGQVLWVALAEPSLAAVQTLAALTGLTVRPLLAAPTAIAERLEAMAAPAQPDQAWLRANPLVAALRAQGIVTWTSLLRLLAGDPRGLDQALDAAGLLTYHAFAALAARLSGLPLVDLQLAPHEEATVTPQGVPATRTVWVDPVDPDAAALLAPGAVEALGLLPVRRDGADLLLAVADPFSPAVEAAVRELAERQPGLRPKLGVAPRPAIHTGLARARGQAPLGERLLAQGIITAGELEKALRLHRGSGVRLGQALLSLGLVSQEQLAYFLAQQLGLPYRSLQQLQPDEALARILPEEVERRLGAVPLAEAEGALVVATSDPLNGAMLDELATRTGRPIRPVVCTEGDLETILERLYRADYLRRSTDELLASAPDQSASRVLVRRQQVGLALTALVVLALLWRAPAALGIALTLICSLFYLIYSAYRLYLIYHALSHSLEMRVSPEELAALDSASLPVYTILLPLYREAAVLPTLLLGLSRLDYPATKLDIKLLLEEDDRETLEAVAATRLPAYVHPVVVPAAPPRGKPKACNYGLIHARGEYVVIFDAEDVPDPDQLRKVVAAFRKAGPEVACLQAKLNYYNARQNLLTRWFTIEYSTWFDLFLPGLDAARVPIPLGGTSNHFITARLREIGAWDPYNVTEDADLGVRLFRRGWRTAVIDSVTYEEANSRIYNWIRQRSRWVKGYMQTYLVHMRRPLALWRALGPRAFVSFNLVVGGTFLSLLLNPIFWALTALWYLTHAGFIRAIYPAPIFYIGTISLFLGNAAFIYFNVAGCLRRGFFDLVRAALISPLYWALMSVAAWRGFQQLWTNPFHWEKTVHGLWRRR